MNAQDTFHPNTRLVYSAWQRMSQGDSPGNQAAEQITDHPDLVGRLFILMLRDDQWVFRNTGSAICTLFGRDPTDYPFLSLWNDGDKELVHAFARNVDARQDAGFVLGHGETLTGQQMKFELMLAPMTINASENQRRRILGLYQPLGDERRLNHRPVWRHHISSIVTPNLQTEAPRLRLIKTEND